jgi:hypothetical protein
MSDSVIFRAFVCLFCGIAFMCAIAAIEWSTR